MSVVSPRGGIIHGFVAIIGPETNPNYFTGTSWSALIDDAKVFRTPGGAKQAARWHQSNSDRPLGATFWATLRTDTVNLILEPRLV